MDYLKSFKQELKPVDNNLIDLFNWIDSQDKFNVYKSNILEVGIGTGHKSIPLAELFDRYIGIEPDPELYKIFQKQCEKHNCKIISYNLDFNDFVNTNKHKEKFDLILLDCVIHFLDFDEFIDRSKQIVISNGFIIIKNPKARPYGPRFINF